MQIDQTLFYFIINTKKIELYVFVLTLEAEVLIYL